MHMENCTPLHDQKKVFGLCEEEPLSLQRHWIKIVLGNRECAKEVMMRTQMINFLDQNTLCVFPTERSNLPEAISELGLTDSSPVIVLIGGAVEKLQAESTRQAIESISQTAEDIKAVVICGGTDMGVMADIGQIRARKGYKFPLVGITP